MVKTKTAIDHFGSVAKLAAALEISRTAIYLWKEDVPLGRAYQLQLMTRGALQANPDSASDAVLVDVPAETSSDTGAAA